MDGLVFSEAQVCGERDPRVLFLCISARGKNISQGFSVLSFPSACQGTSAFREWKGRWPKVGGDFCAFPPSSFLSPPVPPSLPPFFSFLFFLKLWGSHGDFKLLGMSTEVRRVFSWVSQPQVTGLEPIQPVRLHDATGFQEALRKWAPGSACGIWI